MSITPSQPKHMNLAVFLTADGNYHHLGWRHKLCPLD